LTWETLTEATCAVQMQHALSVIELQAFSRSRYPRSGAASLLFRALQMFRLPSITDLLEQWGVSIWGAPTPVVDLTALAGDQWESRAATQFQIAALAVSAEAVDYIDAATIDLSVVVDGVSSTVNVQAPEE
jgi:hypothetical protein